jgi:hypothetical protein
MTEFTSQTITQILPAAGKKLVFIQGVAAQNDDTLTVDKLALVEGCYLRATDGTLGTATWATNVITITNGSTLTWSGFAWGY